MYTSSVPPELGKFALQIEKDTQLLKEVGWSKFVRTKRGRDDFNNLDSVPHPARILLRQYKFKGAPVMLKTPAWTPQQLDDAVTRGPHQSCNQNIDFLEEEFLDMMKKGQWVLLPYSDIKHLKGLRISPPGVIPQRDRRPRWICDYSWSGVNADTVPIAPQQAMQFGQALDRILREIIISDPSKGPVSMMKVDIADGFYRIGLNPRDIPKLGVIFPSRENQPPLVALPLVLPMGWKNSPPVFCASTETSADIANANLATNQPIQNHHLDALASTIPVHASTEPEACPPAQLTLTNGATATANSMPLPFNRDPCLPTGPATAYVDVFVDDFIGLAQNTAQNQKRVRCALLNAIDLIYRPLLPSDPPSRREPVSVKKLRQGDCTWATCKTVLGWIINTVDQTIALPPHRVDRLTEILSSIPPTQKRTSVRKWHKVLGELRSMSIALPGARHLFSQMQQALQHRKKGRLALHKGVHDAIVDFKWLADEVSRRPTRIPEIIPLQPSLLGDHDASKEGAGGIWIPSSHINMREPHSSQKAILWRTEWPEDIKKCLVSDQNPNGTITINDLELAGGLLHLDAAAQNFDVRERTILSRTDNQAALYWQRKASTTTTKSPAHLLRLFGLHQRYHRYVPRHDYIPGEINKLADDASRLFELTDSQLLSHFTRLYPQNLSYELWTPRKQMLSAVITSLRKKRCKRELALADPLPPTATGTYGNLTPTAWPSIPFSKPSATKYLSSKSLPPVFDLASYHQAKIPSALERSRITFGRLARRSLQWA